MRPCSRDSRRFVIPVKFLTFFAAALAALAGAGWDRALAGPSQRLRRLGWAGLGASLVGLALAVAARGQAISYLTRRVPSDPTYGPADIPGAWAATQWAFPARSRGAVGVRGGDCPGPGWALRGIPGGRAAGALLLVTADLALANGGLIWTVPQADFEIPPAAAEQIAAAERAQPSSRPIPHPSNGQLAAPVVQVEAYTGDRLREFINWDRATLHAPYGLPLGLEYCATQGILELDDYTLFLESGLVPIPQRRWPGEPLGAFPRGAGSAITRGVPSTSGAPVISSFPPTPKDGRAKPGEWPRSWRKPS